MRAEPEGSSLGYTLLNQPTTVFKTWAGLPFQTYAEDETIVNTTRMQDLCSQMNNKHMRLRSKHVKKSAAP